VFGLILALVFPALQLIPMSCMVPLNSTEASERAREALLRRREEKMALSPFKLVA
jgi:hypothetical protein